MSHLVQLASDCDDLKTCPGVFAEEGIVADEDCVRVQGLEISDGLRLGPGETGVRIPTRLILEAARKLMEQP